MSDAQPPSATTPAGGPKIELIARGLLQLGGEILLCRNLKHGYFYLPGGKVEFEETSADACVREFEEENGLVIRAVRPLLAAEAVFTQRGRRRHEVSVVFHVEHAGTPPLQPTELREAALESREAKLGFEWADLGVIADLDVRPAIIRAWLASGGQTEQGVMTPWITSVED